MKPIVLIPTLLLFVFMTINYQAILGRLGAKMEAWRLRKHAAEMVVLDNPPDAADSFDHGLSNAWETRVINGSGMVDPGPEFSSGKFEVKDGGLLMYLSKDPDFENKPTSKRYNNVALIGFRGYSPAPDRDIVASAIMQAGPGFFGTAGIVFEPVHTLQRTSNLAPHSTCSGHQLSVWSKLCNSGAVQSGCGGGLRPLAIIFSSRTRMRSGCNGYLRSW
jgi:hypothetical protein